MSVKEYENITGFINGTLKKEDMKEVSEQIQKNKKMNDDNIQFDSGKAWDKLHNKLKANRLQVKKTSLPFGFVRIAASIVLLIGISVFGYLNLNKTSAIIYSEIKSENEIKEIILSDGSVISLNKNSTIKFPKEFSENERLVELTGEAFFNIRKNKKKPFKIKSNNAEITVLGTSFNVRNVKKNISVIVKTGKVKLAKSEREHVLLTAGEQGKIVNDKITKFKNEDNNFLSWKTKQFKYDGEILKNIISDFNRVYNVKIILEKPSIGNLPIVSIINNKSIELALDIICTGNNLEYTKFENKIIVSEQQN